MALFEHTITSGQSLSVGAQYSPQQPGVSTTSEAANAQTVTMAGDLVAHQIAEGGMQRPDLSMGYRIAEAAPAAQWGFSTHGVAGRVIADLSKGGSAGAYENSITAITNAQSKRLAAGDTYKVRAVHWIQGESDQGAGITVDAYLNALQSLRSDYSADIAAITGQGGTLPFIMSQVATWPYYAYPAAVDLAQLKAARTLPGFYVVGGQYQLPYQDALHLTSESYYKLGELHARANLAIAAGSGWAPFAPTGFSVETGKIVVSYAVPSGSLVIDTATVPEQENYGFSLTGTTAQITSVAVTGANQVTLFTDRTVSEESAAVGYGVTRGTDSYRALGNLRDSHPGVSAIDSAPLRNWALHSLDPLGLTGGYIPGIAFTVKSMFAKNAGVYYELG